MILAATKAVHHNIALEDAITTPATTTITTIITTTITITTTRAAHITHTSFAWAVMFTGMTHAEHSKTWYRAVLTLA